MAQDDRKVTGALAIARAVARGLVRAYYPRLVLTGASRIPDGPLFVAANHPNSLVDPVLISVMLPIRVHWLAKATLFENPLAARTLDALGALPVHRRHEGGTRETTDALIRMAADTARGGRVIGIFPEGQSRTSHGLWPLKTGLARMACLAVSEMPAGSQVHVLPVVLHFSDLARFRSDAVVAVGDPVAVTSSSTPEEVTDAVRRGLESMLVHVEDDDQAALLADVRRFVRRRLAAEAGVETVADHHELDVALASAVRRFCHEEPDRVERFRLRLTAWLGAMGREGLTPGAFDARSVARPGRLALSLALAPLAALGVVQSWAPWRAAGALVRARTRGDMSLVPTLGISGGVVLFPLAWIVESILVGILIGAPAAAGWLALAPFAGLAARWAPRAFAVEVRRISEAHRTSQSQGALESLRAEAAWLGSEIDRWRELHRSAEAAARS